jgi:hypothetical protein
MSNGRRLFLGGTVLGLGLGLAVAFGATRLSRSLGAEPPPVRVVSAMPELAAALRSSEPAEEPAPVPVPLHDDPDPAELTAAARVMPQRAQLPLAAKLAAEPQSGEPHRLLGAWDEAPDEPEPGARRAFVVLVDPGADDASLERLARDIRERNRDAAILDVRIYDDERAALEARALDGGRTARLHLVGEVKTNRALALDVVRVRGRSLTP